MRHDDEKGNGNRGRVSQSPLNVSSMIILVLTESPVVCLSEQFTSEMSPQWIRPDSAHPSPDCPPGLQEQRT